MNKNITFVIYAVVALAIIIFMTAILKKLGIFKTKEKKEAEVNISEMRDADYFNPTYYRTVKFKPLGLNQSQEFAKSIRKALRGAGTDEEMIYSIFNQMFNKTNISEVAEAYYIEYNRDMKTDILNDLSQKEVSVLMNIIKEKPLNT